MEKNENIDLVGKLCKHRKNTVLVIALFKRQSKAFKNNELSETKSYWVLFPNASIDVVSEKSLNIIK